MQQAPVEVMLEKILEGKKLHLPHLSNELEAMRFLQQLRVKRTLLNKKLSDFGVSIEAPDKTISFTPHETEGYIFHLEVPKRRKVVAFSIIDS